MTRVMSVQRTYRFEAAHLLPWHQGRCRKLHGHTYTLAVRIRGPLDDNGVVMDFHDLDRVVESTVLNGERGLDHAYLNDLIDNPTAEHVVLEIGSRLDSAGLAWDELTLWETRDGAVVLSR